MSFFGMEFLLKKKAELEKELDKIDELIRMEKIREQDKLYQEKLNKEICNTSTIKINLLNESFKNEEIRYRCKHCNGYNEMLYNLPFHKRYCSKECHDARQRYL